MRVISYGARTPLILSRHLRCAVINVEKEIQIQRNAHEGMENIAQVMNAVALLSYTNADTVSMNGLIMEMD